MRLTRLFLGVWMAAIYGFLVFHVTMLLIFNSPTNPIRLAAGQFATAYVVSAGLFQNWRFFAPDPVDESEYFLVRGRDSHGHATPWLNVSEHLIEKMQHNRLSADEFLSTGVSNAIIIATRDRGMQGGTARGMGPQNNEALRYLYRTGSSALRLRYPARRFTQAQMAIEFRVFPRFTKRAKQTDDADILQTYAWSPFFTDVDGLKW